MKLVIQRVTKARVSVKGKVVGEIGAGLFVLVGFSKEDREDYVDSLADKLAKLRIMADDNLKMNLSVTDSKTDVLVVSQFTLYADTKNGNRPSFIDAAHPTDAKKLYKKFVDRLKTTGLNVQTGEFGEYMDIDAALDGPVTIILENE